MAKRDTAIETLRGLAVILMVAGHVIGATAEIEMEVPDDSWWRYAYFTTTPYRMPLFTTISGFVYALRPISWSTAGDFAAGKARRLLVPFVVVSTLVFGASLLMGRGMPYKAAEFYKIYYLPFDMFWFLQAILLVFVYVAAVELLELMRTPQTWAASLTAAGLAYLVLPRTTFFSFHSSLYLLPFFVLGLGLQRFSALFRSPAMRCCLVAGFLVTFGMFQAQRALGWHVSIYTERLLFLVAGISACALAFQPRLESRWLAWLGSYAFGIYLLHIIFVSGSRILFQRFTGGTTPYWLVFPVGLTLGLAMPVLIERNLNGAQWLTLLVFGQKSRRVALPLPEPAPRATA